MNIHVTYVLFVARYVRNNIYNLTEKILRILNMVTRIKQEVFAVAIELLLG